MLSSQRLLIVEDVPMIALDIQRIVEDARAHQPVFARDFAEATDLLERFGDFDLAIINPPARESSHMEIVARLVRAGPAIVVCTAARTDLTGTPLEGAETVAKPFSDEQLLAACRRALAKRSA